MTERGPYRLLDMASELIAAKNELLADRGVAAVVCRVLRDSPFLKVLGSHGYIRAPLQTGCLLSPDRIGAAELRDLLKGCTHHITMGDFDWSDDAFALGSDTQQWGSIFVTPRLNKRQQTARNGLPFNEYSRVLTRSPDQAVSRKAISL